MVGVKRRLETAVESTAAPAEGGITPEELSQSECRPSYHSTGRTRGGRRRVAPNSKGNHLENQSVASNHLPAEELAEPPAKRAKKTPPLQEASQPVGTRKSARLLNKARANSVPHEAPTSQDVIEVAAVALGSTGQDAATSPRTRHRGATDKRSRSTATASASLNPQASTLSQSNTSSKAVSSSIGARDAKGNTIGNDGISVSNDAAPERPGDQAEKSLSTSQSGTGSGAKNTSTTSGGRKRKNLSGDETATDTFHLSKRDEKPKLEDNNIVQEVQRRLQNGTGKIKTYLPPIPEVIEPQDKVKACQAVQSGVSAPQDDIEPSTIGKGRSAGRGRGRRRRGRGGARGWKGHGRGGGRVGKQVEEYPDIIIRSPSPCPATQRLRERQKELDKAFKKVATAQRLALAVLADQSQRRLLKSKKAHLKAPEHSQVQKDLDALLRQCKAVLRRDYELKVEQANILLEANKDLLERQFRASALHIQEEHLTAAQGELMALIDGHQHAEDDDHTEPEESGSVELRELCLFLHEKRYKRGLNSSFVREPIGAAVYERASSGWDDFVQRAKLGGDLDPQMKNINQEARQCMTTDVQKLDMVSMLLDATEAMAEGDAAMLTLADAATAELLRTQQGPTILASCPSAPRAILPQPIQPQVTHGPVDPRLFLLPRPQPRQLLPAQAGLPPQLPPPQGASFQHPGSLPGFLPATPLYFAPPPLPPPGPSPSRRPF